MLCSDTQALRSYLCDLQQKICGDLSDIDGMSIFHSDTWVRDSDARLQGTGMTCTLENGGVFEKVGVNFSHVYGNNLPDSARMSRGFSDSAFEALGLSLVAHPDNPYVPTSHMNVRFFSTRNKVGENSWWFGGGFDLTPYYGFEEDCIHWHTVAKQACDPFGSDIYPELKRWCDDYFFIQHRHEPRGIGGLFFDDWNRWDFDTCFSFMRSVGDAYLKAYLPIVERRKNIPFGEREKKFQKIRRGRYVEFNLLYDRGTLFGLQSGGRTESILMSLPKEVSWVYNYHPDTGSQEEALLTKFLTGKDWIQ